MRLLLAEDEQSLSKALVAILEGNHYSVDAVYDGVDALAYLDAGNYDAAVISPDDFKEPFCRYQAGGGAQEHFQHLILFIGKPETAIGGGHLERMWRSRHPGTLDII